MDKEIAKRLLDIEAVRLSPEKPFTWASGWKSPIYCDNRRVLSNVDFRNQVVDALVAIIQENYPKVEVIAGVATGAIAFGALVADRMNKPFIYVRPKPKDHGTGNQIEGVLPEGAKVVVVEDLISTGGSALSVLDCLHKAGAIVLGMAAIFSYNFDIARRAFENANCVLHTLSHYNALLEVAVETHYISQADLETLKVWRLMPGKWNA